jgi:hypothetical protein
MSHIAINRSEALHSFTLTHEQVNHIAISLASDIGAAEHLMPRDFLECHNGLLEMFLDYLTQKEKLRIMGSVSAVRISQ